MACSINNLEDKREQILYFLSNSSVTILLMFDLDVAGSSSVLVVSFACNSYFA